MLNNNEKSIFLENAIWIDPEIISPDDLRSWFFPFYWGDLILTSGDGENKIEFLLWIPFWFETLGLYVNLRRIFDTKKLSTFSEMENVIREFHEKKPELVALWIWAGNTAKNINLLLFMDKIDNPIARIMFPPPNFCNVFFIPFLNVLMANPINKINIIK